MLKIQGSQAFMKKLRKDHELMKGKIASTHREIVAAQFKDLVMATPQWSGKLTRSWYISYVNVPAGPPPPPTTNWGRYSWGPMPGPYIRGAEPSVSSTLARESSKIPGIRWNTKVSFVNTANYASEVLEQGIGPTYGGKVHPIRPKNLYAGQMVAATYVRQKWGRTRMLQRFKK